MDLAAQPILVIEPRRKVEGALQRHGHFLSLAGRKMRFRQQHRSQRLVIIVVLLVEKIDQLADLAGQRPGFPFGKFYRAKTKARGMDPVSFLNFPRASIRFSSSPRARPVSPWAR